MELTSYQKKIVTFFNDNPNFNMYINAKAGCGKSFIATQLLKDVDRNSIYLAFNKSIAEEMKEKITNPKVKICTIHSLCNSILLYNLSQKANNQTGGLGKNRNTSSKLDNLKIYKILNDIFMQDKDINKDFDYRSFLTENYVKLYNLVRLKVIDLDKGFEAKMKISDIVNEQGLFFHETYHKPTPDETLTLIRQIDKKSLEMFEKEQIYDFTDMLYITLNKLRGKEWEVPGWNLYTNIVADESQDLSTIQLFLLKYIKRKGGRYIFILDPHQCQPYGTKILLRNGQIKNIEDVEIGDKVVQYAGNGYSCFVGATNQAKSKSKEDFMVIDKQEFIAHNLIKITTAQGKTSIYTLNHKVFVKLNEQNTKEAYCLYLMHKKQPEYFRIGIVKLYGYNSTLGLKCRCRSEGFDEAWILNIYDTQTEAWIQEQAYSLKYQIPQCIFQFDRVNYKQSDVDYIYNTIGGNIRERAESLLQEFHRNINAPIYKSKDINTHIARTHSFVTEAYNIIPKYMDCIIFNPEQQRKLDSKGHKKGYQVQYDNIISTEYINQDTKVVGLTTNRFHTYIADGIATHNSIYSFAGANPQSYQLIKKLFAPITEFDLPINYRCATSHLDLVNKLHKIGIKPCDTAPVGKIERIGKSKCIELAQAGDYIVGRKNKWLLPVTLELIKKGKPVYIKDEGFVKEIERLIEKTKSDSIIDLERKILLKEKRLSEKLTNEKDNQQKEEQNPVEIEVDAITFTQDSEDKSGQMEMFSAIKMLLASFKEKYTTHSKSQFLKYVQTMLNTTPSDNCVMITSIHCVKGLEANNVFVLNEGKAVIDGNMSAEQRQQEFNLSYVALTRAKENLYLVKPEGEEY